MVDGRNIWIDPYCDLKTRDWPETKQALEVLIVKVAKKLRKEELEIA